MSRGDIRQRRPEVINVAQVTEPINLAQELATCKRTSPSRVPSTIIESIFGIQSVVDTPFCRRKDRRCQAKVPQTARTEDARKRPRSILDKNGRRTSVV
jgi:hypothetical protein